MVKARQEAKPYKHAKQTMLLDHHQKNDVGIFLLSISTQFHSKAMHNCKQKNKKLRGQTHIIPDEEVLSASQLPFVVEKVPSDVTNMPRTTASMTPRTTPAPIMAANVV